MKRGDLVTVSVSGDFGKPRPALVIQADQFSETDTVTVLLLTSTIRDAPLLRHTIEPSAENGLRVTCQIQLDKAMSVSRSKVGSAIGRLDDDATMTVSRLLALFLGIA